MNACSVCSVRAESLVKSLPHDYALVRDLRGKEVASNDAWARLIMTEHMTTELYAKIDLLSNKLYMKRQSLRR